MTTFAYLTPNGTDDTTAINAAATTGQQLGKGTFKISGIISGRIRGQGPDTIIQAQNAASGVEYGPALPGAPLNWGDNPVLGGFNFDANNIATGGTKHCAVHTNCVQAWFFPIQVINLPTGVEGVSICGQNNAYFDINAGVPTQSGPVFSIFFDNGAGGNTIYTLHTNGHAIDFRETVGTHGYVIPEHNVIKRWVADQFLITTADYCVRHTAGAYNVIQDVEVITKAPALIKFETDVRNYTALPINGRLIIAGKGAWAGTTGVSGQYWIWSDYSSNGSVAAGGMGGDIGMVIMGHHTIAQVDGEVKWGTSTPLLGIAPDITRFGSNSGTRPLWTTSGTGALTDAAGSWKIGGKFAFGGFPDLTAAESFQVKSNQQRITSGTSPQLALRTVTTSQALGLSLGRTTDEAQVGVAGAAGNYLAFTNAGDLVFRLLDTTKKMHFGVDSGTGAAIFTISNTTMALNKPIDMQTHKVQNLADAQAATDAVSRDYMRTSMGSVWTRNTSSTAENYDRKGSDIDTGLLLQSGRQCLTGGFRVYNGQTFNHVTFIGGYITGAGYVNCWVGIYDLSGNFLRGSFDYLNNRPLVAGAEVTYDLSSAWSPAGDTSVYAGIVIVATTMPDLMGVQSSTTVLGSSPVLAGFYTSGLSAPSSSAATTFSAVDVQPYCYLS